MTKMWKKHLRIGLISVIANLLLCSPSWSAEQYAIFTMHEGFDVLSKNKARKLYRGKTKRLNGMRVELSDWPKDSGIREEFYLSLLGKNLSQMNAYWASLSFSGKARPPKELEEASVAALIEWMHERPHRIGYAPFNLVPDNATVLFLFETEN